MKITGPNSRHAEIAEHVLEWVEVTRFSTQGDALYRKGSDSLQVPLEDRMNGLRQHQLDRRGKVIQAMGDRFGLIEVAPRRFRIASHSRGRRTHRQRLGQQCLLPRLSSGR